MRRFLNFLTAASLIMHSVPGNAESFDFSDEPDYVTSGEDRAGYPDGNCVGGGCGDRPDRVRAENRGADKFDQERYDFDRDEHDRYERDQRGQTFERGDDGSQDRNAGLNSTDRSELYYDDRGRDYVKSSDGRFLPIDGLLECSKSLTCHDIGYKTEWWTYPSFPGETSSMAQEYFENAHFAKNSHQIATSVKQLEGKVDAVFLWHINFLNQEANKYFTAGSRQEADNTQEAARQLVGLFIDIGIGFTPLAWGRDVYEFTTGKSLVGGHRLSSGERLLAGLGVAIPGAVPLAVAGMKIIKRASAIDKTLSAIVPNIYKLTELSNGLKPIRFKAGSEFNKVAIIGRDMGVVKSVESHLLGKGLDVKVFEPSRSSLTNLSRAGDSFPDGRVPYAQIPKTEIYKENVKWIADMKSEGRTFIDYGDPNAKNIKDGFSAFYDVEVSMVFGK